MVPEIRYEVALNHHLLPNAPGHNFHPRCQFRIERGGYVVKTLEQWDEVLAALRLRHEIFHREQNGRILDGGVDVDEIDAVCDHIAVVNIEQGRLIGAYRLTSSDFSTTFYSQKHFDLDYFLSLPGSKLELGRACVDKSHRNGTALHLLWRGVSEYAKRSGARFLFGSASLRTVDPAIGCAVYDYLKERGHVSEEFKVRTNATHQVIRPVGKENIEPADLLRLMPPLFQSYLKAGAKVCAEPALDLFLGSTDYLMVLDLDMMTSRFERRYR